MKAVSQEASDESEESGKWRLQKTEDKSSEEEDVKLVPNKPRDHFFMSLEHLHLNLCMACPASLVQFAQKSHFLSSSLPSFLASSKQQRQFLMRCLRPLFVLGCQSTAQSALFVFSPAVTASWSSRSRFVASEFLFRLRLRRLCPSILRVARDRCLPVAHRCLPVALLRHRPCRMAGLPSR